MKVLKGFVTHQKLIDNTIDQVAPIGELSTWGMTYTRDRAEYYSDNYPDYHIVSVRYYDQTTGVLPLDNTVAERCLQVTDTVYQYAEDLKQANLPFSATELTNLLLNNLNQTIGSIYIGNIITYLDLQVPEWIAYTDLDHDVEVRLWYSDNNFVSNFDEYEIIVVPPFTPIDDFFAGDGTVGIRVREENINEYMDRIQLAKGDDPETYIRTYIFDYHSQVDPNVIIPTNWTVIIYGIAGDYIDYIKQAIIKYLEDNSQYPLSEWEKILPDLFRTTRFYILPRWDKVAIPNMVTIEGVFSSLMNPIEVIGFCQNKLPSYPGDIQNRITITQHPYRNIVLNIVDGYRNVTGKERFSELYPDYISVPSTHLDFNRMSDYTKNFLLMLDDVLIEAEKATEYSSTPVDMRKVKKDGILYISKVYDDIEYLVAALVNYGAI